MHASLYEHLVPCSPCCVHALCYMHTLLSAPHWPMSRCISGHAHLVDTHRCILCFRLVLFTARVLQLRRVARFISQMGVTLEWFCWCRVAPQSLPHSMPVVSNTKWVLYVSESFFASYLFRCNRAVQRSSYQMHL